MSRFLPERPPVPAVLPPQLEFQLIDILDAEQTNTFYLFGLTTNDNSIMVKIGDYRHHLFIGTDMGLPQVEEMIKTQFKEAKFTVTEAPEKRSIYAQSIQPAHFYKIDCHTAHTFRLLKGMKNVKLFNSDIESKTRFLVDCDGVGCGWFRLD